MSSEERPELRSKVSSRLNSKSTRKNKTPSREATRIYDRLGYDYTPDNARAFVAEFFAMVLFVWVGCGTAVSAQAEPVFNTNATSGAFLVTVALAFGFGISVLAYSIAPISGGHINPAVTFAFVLLGDMSIVQGALYMLFQILGALLGAALVWGTADASVLGDPPFNVGLNAVAPGLPLGSAFLGEMIGTFLLVWTVMMTAVYNKNIAGNLAPIAIGWSVFLAHVVLIPLTGCGINPARSLGPLLVTAMAGGVIPGSSWIFYTAPFVGAGLAALITKYLFGVMKDDEGILGESSHVEPPLEKVPEVEEVAAE